MKLIIILLIVTVFSESARIIAVYPVPSISHQVAFRPLTLELIKRGHEVTVITTDPVFPKGKAPENLTEINLHDISNKIWSDLVKKSTGKRSDMTSQVAAIFDLMNKICDAQFENDEVENIIKNRREDFDLLIIESCVRPPLAFTHIFKVPVIQISSFGNWIWNYDIMGAPSHPLLYPTMTNQKSFNLSIWEKIREIYNHVIIKYITYMTEDTDIMMMRKYFGDDLPNMDVLMGNVDMLFLNVHPMWEGNRPVPPGVVFMGGIHQKPPQELPTDLKSYLDSSKHGVIYMSFGTNAKPSLLPSETIQVFVRVFSKLPYDILWKWDEDELPGRSKNINIQKWLPQSDLLRHPKIKFFITQGGLQSTDESITAGVPMLGIPLLADQWSNTEKYVKFGIGLQLDIELITEDIFRDAIDTILRNDSYCKNVIKLRNLMYDQPEKPLDRAIWWMEYLIRHKSGKHLRSPAANMSLLKYLEIEIFGVIFILFLLLLLVIVVMFVKYFVFIFSRTFKSTIKIKDK